MPGSRGAVLRLLRRHHRLSRAEISERSGLSEASVSRTVADLIRGDIVEEEGLEPSTGGRPAIRLRLSDRRYYSFGVDVDSWETRFTTCTPSGQVRDLDCVRTPRSPDEVMKLISERVKSHIGARQGFEAAGVGVAIRGIVDSRTGIVEVGHDNAWKSIAVRDGLRKRLSLPVFIDNNVRAAAFSEYHYGSPDVRDAHCLLFVGVEDGIGVSILFDGEVYPGQHMAAGEFGQMVIAHQHVDTRHDRPGCLEQLASDSATCRRYLALKGDAKKEPASDPAGLMRQICHLAKAGDSAALTALEETARYLGVGVANMVWGLDPDAVIVDGLITEAWSLVVPSIRKQFPQGPEFVGFRNLVLRPSALGGQASLVGAAVLPFRELFTTGELPRFEDSVNREARSA